MNKSVIVICLFSLLLLNGCGNNDNSEKLKWRSKKHITSKEMAAECMDYFANAFNEKQTDIIIDLLPDSALENKDTSIYKDQVESLYSYINNDIVSFDIDLPPDSSVSNDRGTGIVTYRGYYRFFTNDDTFWIRFDLCTRNDENPKEIGLTRIIVASSQVKERENFNWLYYNDPPGFYTVQ